MNYIILGLGILLAAAGCLSIYAGYDIIQLERGWTEVIAGATAVSGGIVTIALSALLWQFKRLGAVLASIQSQPELQTLAAAQSGAQVLYADAVHAVEPPADDGQPLNPALLSAVPLTGTETIQATEPEALKTASRKSVFMSALTKQRAKKAVFSRHDPIVQPPEALTTEGLTTEALATGASASDPYEEAVEPANHLDRQKPETVIKSPAMLSASSLSLDEMWRRVSDEIEKPIFPSAEPYTAPPKIAANATAVAQSSPAPAFELPQARFQPASDHDAAGVSIPASIAAESIRLAPDAGDPSPKTHVADHPAPSGFTLEPPQSMIESFETQPLASENVRSDGEFQSPRSAGKPASILPDPALEHPAFMWTRLKADNKSFEPPPLAEPAVTGRYESDGTAYLMFADGSIEAQSEAGIFRFASMAELKTFIESKQAAEL